MPAITDKDAITPDEYGHAFARKNLGKDKTSTHVVDWSGIGWGTVSPDMQRGRDIPPTESGE